MNNRFENLLMIVGQKTNNTQLIFEGSKSVDLYYSMELLLDGIYSVFYSGKKRNQLIVDDYLPTGYKKPIVLSLYPALAFIQVTDKNKCDYLISYHKINKIREKGENLTEIEFIDSTKVQICVNVRSVRNKYKQCVQFYQNFQKYTMSIINPSSFSELVVKLQKE